MLTVIFGQQVDLVPINNETNLEEGLPKEHFTVTLQNVSKNNLSTKLDSIKQDLFSRKGGKCSL